MKKAVIAALLAAQVAPALPASAAEIPNVEEDARSEFGTLAGARFRIQFGGAESGKPRFGVGLAPAHRSLSRTSGIRSSFGEGVELGFSGSGKPALSVAGTMLGGESGRFASSKRKAGLSTIETAALAGSAIVLGAIAIGLFAPGAINFD